ncbi:hypothetical protein [Streptomyces sp. NHF165]|uniref:hypothetical protein n=1 Tax=Streptomyces sp. NHF165 TaxID=2175864 RepID=UPI0019174FE9|nr:hypothetical protein [Streptomyces sp. NHF165]
MRRVAVPALGVLAAATFVAACSSESPSEAGEEYGTTIQHGDVMVECIVEATHRFESDKDQDAFSEACQERAER